MSIGPDDAPRSGPWIAVLVIPSLAGLVALAMSRYLPFANADALLYSLISTRRLTLFYWGQNRLANLVPALAWPFRETALNFYVQMAILGSSFFLLLGVFAWFHSANRRRPIAPSTVVFATVASGVTVMALLTPITGFTFVIEQQYALSTLLFLVGLRWVSSPAIHTSGSGAALILLGTSLIPPVVLLAPLGLLVRDNVSTVRRLVAPLISSAIAFVAVAMASAAASDDTTQSDTYTDFSLARLLRGFPEVVERILGSTHRTATLVAAAACVTVLVVRRRHFSRSLKIAYMLGLAVSLGWIVMFSANRWVELNGFHYRYFFPFYAAGLFLLVGAIAEAAGLAVEGGAAIFERFGAICERADNLRRWGYRTLVTSALLLAAIASVRASDIAIPAVEQGEAAAASISELDVEVVVGTYWQVWPIVFAADDSELLGVSLRSDPLYKDFVELANEASAGGTPVSVLCVDGDIDQCVTDLERFSSFDWKVESVSSTEPLVIEVVRPSR